MRRHVTLLLGLFGAAALTVAAERDAAACGGCFHPPPAPNETESVITDHRMILSVSPQQTTLYDQIRYQGNPASFAWVLPIAGTVTVGLSSDALFAGLDALTQTTLVAPAPPVCPGPPQGPYCSGEFGGASGGGEDAGVAFSDSSAPPPVTVTHQQTVGPYETVQLHSSDANALTDWLTSHGYVIPSDVQPIIAAYVNEHFDFLAMKLVPGVGVQAMRPVRVTSAGASPVLPLRMVAAGTGATVGITLWVVADGRWEPSNFPTFTIDASELVWDWSASESNYTTLRAQKEAALSGGGWQIESSDTVQVASFNYPPYGPQPSDYDPAAATPDGGPGETSDQVLADDLRTLFADVSATPRVTRMRADLAKAALATDLQLQAGASQAVLPSHIQITQQKNVPPCPTYPPAPQTCPPGTYPVDPNNPNGANGTGGSSTDTFSCAAAPASADGALTLAGLAGLVVLSVSRTRRRRPR